jgi:hypothetical protein
VVQKNRSAIRRQQNRDYFKKEQSYMHMSFDRVTLRFRNKTAAIGLTVLLTGASILSLEHFKAAAQAPHQPAITKTQIQENVGRLPLAFEINKGQTDARVKYLAKANGYTAFFTSDEAVLRMKGASNSVLRMKLLGANTTTPRAEGLQSGKSNYLIGKDRSKWVVGVDHYNKVQIQQRVLRY